MLTTAEVVLVGYYGRSNFGDDVLMVVAHRIVRQLMSTARIGLLLGTAVTYPERLLGEEITRIPFGTRDRHRLIIHGGGGTYFDFSQHGLRDRAANAILFSVGSRAYVTAEAALRSVVGRPRMSAETRLGLGMGIGTFSSGSPRLRESLPVLADFDALWLRDAESSTNLLRLGIRPPVVLGSDLAFLWDTWCPPHLALKPAPVRNGRPRIGIILRDWPTGTGGSIARSLRPAIDALEERYDLQLISFDSSTDIGTMAELSHLPGAQWRPDESDIASFAEILAQQDVLLTARAHGAICGACLGRPSIILDIEPKLANVHRMLPDTTRLIHPGADSEALSEKIQDALAIPATQIEAEVCRNRKASERALANVRGKGGL